MMVASCKFRGHAIWFDESSQVWRYSDGARVPDAWQARPCGHCGRHNTPDGHDACLGELPDVMNACCGHGEIEAAYVQFSDGFTVRGEAASYAIECYLGECSI